ncbi:MAG: hypothetical protein K6F37_06870 [Lachnospiraceae bacterium]|nr:hypothetical protein [Lachnospiraceae bacterium]
MFFFKRKKKQPTIDLDEEVSSLYLSDDDRADSRKVQHFVFQRCEQILEANKEVEQEMREYKLVTSYINDISVLDELNDEDKKRIHHLADGLVSLEKSRGDLIRNSKVNIDDSTFRTMQINENEIPDAIKRLRENETWENTVKRDMQYLEAEKTRWNYLIASLEREQMWLRFGSYILIGLFAVAVIFLCFVHFGLKIDVSFGWMIATFIACVLGVLIFVKMQNNSREIIQARVNSNYAVTLNNKLTFKYVNVKNAVDYACEKFKVTNSYELNYLWEQYLLAVKERNKLSDMDSDMDYYSDRLVKELGRIGIHDPQIWVHQAEALINKKEMVEVKHNWIVRRQKLRERISFNKDNISKQRSEIDELLLDETAAGEELRQIVDSLDKLEIARE